MNGLLQTVTAAVLAALVGGRVAVTRTGRLRRTINTNLGLLGRLPADHPNRAALEANNGELLSLLVRRQQRRFGPFTQAGASFGALANVASVALVLACVSALLAVGAIPLAAASAPSISGNQWAVVAFLLIVAAGCAAAEAITIQRRLQEHRPSAQQPTEAG
jgi:hypothetical protein